jgi:hypothetical protein
VTAEPFHRLEHEVENIVFASALVSDTPIVSAEVRDRARLSTTLTNISAVYRWDTKQAIVRKAT